MSTFGGAVDWKLGVGNTRVHGNDTQFSDTSGSIDAQSMIQFQIVLQRKARHHERYVIPMVLMMAILPWLVFFLSPPDKFVVPRVTLPVITFLALSNTSNSIRQTLPAMSEDVLLLRLITVTMGFAFATLVEIAAQQYQLSDNVVEKYTRLRNGSTRLLHRLGMRKTTSDAPKSATMTSATASSQEELTLETAGSGKMSSIPRLLRAENLEYASRIGYPVAYAVFLGFLNAERLNGLANQADLTNPAC